MRVAVGVLAVAVALAGCGGDGGDAVGPQTNTCVGTCIVVTNSTSLTINTVLFAACDDSDWGANRLGGGRLRPGSSRGWTVTPDCYDIRASAPSGEGTYTVTHVGIDIAADESYAFLFQVTPPP